jgi:uncharacterized membrane protein YphA (DoxX/SURF4 family)
MIIELVASFYVLLFLYSAIMKLRNLDAFSTNMYQIPLLRPFANMLAVALPVIEILIALILIIPATRRVGILLATSLLGIFSIYIIYIFYTMDDLPCSCGGIIQQMSWKAHLIFNLILCLLGTSCLVMQKRSIAINRRSRIPGI